MIEIVALLLILASLAFTMVAWRQHGWSPSYWVPFGAAIVVAVLLIIGAIV